ncbi:GNAT family N-acetyltransferase [Ammoniphilus sp. YIM 78166]|uniref:GNAT family N-acetyltransferase n=1 Tax=Ammoniphilus sp. YIM 78166 TaxID=1644106 RepID=UPI00106F89CE|nr:GNAT family N-acetyltransferase [Ammoniphilus sp. YIM 78166]
MRDIEIKQISQDEIPQVLNFCRDIIKEIFPMMDPMAPQDLKKLEQIYILPDRATFLAAYSEEGSVVATIAARPYDGRIQQLKGLYDLQTTIEIVRCFVAPEFRRLGLGSKLVAQVIPFCKDAGYKTLYLHTHRFLPGAVEFWKNQGFTITVEDHDPTWLTVHMENKNT